MIYTPLTKKAMALAVKAHEGQTDRSGLPYVLHPVIVADHVEGGELEVCAALLHDVVEDTDTTFDDLSQAGIPEPVIEALRLLTHDKSMPYMDYVAAIKANPIATAVKRADLTHNMQTERLDEVTDEDLERLAKYKQAYRLLSE